MSGLWDIARGSLEANIPRINVLLLRTELMGVALGLRTRAMAKINIESELGRALTLDEINDLILIANQFESGSIADRLVYNIKTEFALNAAELNLIEEEEFRTVLGIL